MHGQTTAFSLSLSVSPFFSGPPQFNTHTYTHTPVKRLICYSGICMPHLTHGYFMSWSSNRTHHTSVGGRPKLLESLSSSAFPQYTVLGLLVQSLLKLSHVIYPIILQCYTITFDWKAGVRRRKLSLKMVMQQWDRNKSWRSDEHSTY